MPKDQKDNVYSSAEIEDIRSRAQAVIDREGGTVRDYATESGISYSTLHAWLGGKYAGDNSRVAEQVVVWLESRDTKKRASMIVPRDPGFIQTPTAEALTTAMMYAQVMPEIAVIAGGAGIGKTTAARQFQAKNPNVWMTTIEPCSKSTYPMLSAIADEMNLTEKVQTKLSRAIGDKIRNTGGLIIIDEAQHLDTMAVDQLRVLHDKYQIGIVLMGNELVYSKLEGEGRKAGFAQLFSRIGHRVTQTRSRGQDICMLLAAWGVTEKAELQFLKAIGKKPGALRVLGKVLKLATMLATGSGEDRSIDHIKAAWSNLSTSTDNAA